MSKVFSLLFLASNFVLDGRHNPGETHQFTSPSMPIPEPNSLVLWLMGAFIVGVAIVILRSKGDQE